VAKSESARWDGVREGDFIGADQGNGGDVMEDPAALDASCGERRCRM